MYEKPELEEHEEIISIGRLTCNNHQRGKTEHQHRRPPKPWFESGTFDSQLRDLFQKLEIVLKKKKKNKKIKQ